MFPWPSAAAPMVRVSSLSPATYSDCLTTARREINAPPCTLGGVLLWAFTDSLWLGSPKVSPKLSPNSKRNGLVLPSKTSPSAKKQLDDRMDIDDPKENVGAVTVELDVMGKANGSARAKRKAVKPAVKEEESSDSEAPLVRTFFSQLGNVLLTLCRPNAASKTASRLKAPMKTSPSSSLGARKPAVRHPRKSRPLLPRRNRRIRIRIRRWP